MGKLCKKCGMESDRDDICTWCNADLRPPKQAQPKAQTTATRSQVPAGTAAAPSASTPSTPRARRPEPVELPPEKPAWLMPLIVGGGIIVLLVVILLVVGIAASGAPPDPGTWKTFVEKDKQFTAQYPGGWAEPSNSGSSGSYVSVDFRAGKLCWVQVQGTQKAGSMGDLAAAAARMSGGQVTVERSADGAVLAGSTASFKAQRPGFKEEAMKQASDFGGGKSACAAYTYTKRVGLLPIKMKGIRWGAFKGDFGYTVFAEAPEKHWAKFQPVAQKIVSSVQFGGGTG